MVIFFSKKGLQRQQTVTNRRRPRADQEYSCQRLPHISRPTEKQKSSPDSQQTLSSGRRR